MTLYELCKSSYQGCKLRTKINIFGLVTKLDGVKCRKKVFSIVTLCMSYFL